MERLECQCHQCENVWTIESDTDPDDVMCSECGSNDVEIEIK